MRWPISISGAMPPIVVNESSPFSSMFVIVDPDLVDVTDERERRRAVAPARTRANDVPSVSDVTSANAEAASRQMRAGSSSCPDGPGAVSSDRRSSGRAIGLRIQAGAPTLASDELPEP